MKRARFIGPARKEFLAEIAHYNQAQTGLGSRFGLALEAAVARALAFPTAGTPSSANTRRVHVKSFPFSITYRQESDGIMIIAIEHHSRRPGYWKNRV